MIVRLQRSLKTAYCLRIMPYRPVGNKLDSLLGSVGRRVLIMVSSVGTLPYSTRAQGPSRQCSGVGAVIDNQLAVDHNVIDTFGVLFGVVKCGLGGHFVRVE